MDEYPIKSTAKVYFDMDDNPVTLRQLIRAQPEWAHSRIKVCEELEVKVADLESKLAIDTLNPNRREHINKLVARIEELEAQSEWVSVEAELPVTGRKVIATYVNNSGKRRIIIADYYPRWTIESDSDDCFDEYHEGKDAYFYCEGWYEQQDNWGDYASIFVSEGQVDNWRALPPSPDSITEKGKTK